MSDHKKEVQNTSEMAQSSFTASAEATMAPRHDKKIVTGNGLHSVHAPMAPPSCRHHAPTMQRWNVFYRLQSIWPNAPCCPSVRPCVTRCHWAAHQYKATDCCGQRSQSVWLSYAERKTVELCACLSVVCDNIKLLDGIILCLSRHTGDVVTSHACHGFRVTSIAAATARTCDALFPRKGGVSNHF